MSRSPISIVPDARSEPEKPRARPTIDAKAADFLIDAALRLVEVENKMCGLRLVMSLGDPDQVAACISRDVRSRSMKLIECLKMVEFCLERPEE